MFKERFEKAAHVVRKMFLVFAQEYIASYIEDEHRRRRQILNMLPGRSEETDQACCSVEGLEHIVSLWERAGFTVLVNPSNEPKVWDGLGYVVSVFGGLPDTLDDPDDLDDGFCIVFTETFTYNPVELLGDAYQWIVEGAIND